MRQHPGMEARVPITDPHQLSRQLNKLVRGQKDLDFESTLEYPTDGRLKPARPWDEVLTITVEVNHNVAEEDDDETSLNSLQLTVTSYSDGKYGWGIQIDYEDKAEYEAASGDDLDAAFSKMYELIWPPAQPDIPAEAPAPAAPVELPHIKLVQQALTNGPQVTWLSWLDITKFDSLNRLVSFQVACSMVGYAVHIADVPHFLRAIDFDLNTLNAPRHSISTRVLSALRAAVKGKANVEGSCKLNDSRGPKYIVFLLELQDGTGVINGMIDLREEDDDEDDEVDD